MRFRLASNVGLRRNLKSFVVERPPPVGSLGGASCGFSVGAAEAEPEPEGSEGEEGADGVEKGIVRRGGAASDEGLVDFVHDGIACGHREGGNAPGPTPAFAIAPDAAVDEEAENEIFGEVGGLADDVVDEMELVLGEVRDEPFHEEGENGGSVFGGEGVGGKGEDDAGPGNGGPPGTKPRRNEKLVQPRLHLWELGRGARIAPRLFSQDASLG